MSYKPKIRAYVCINERERELLAIRELSDGSLVMIVAMSDNAIFASGNNVAYQEEHHSVHRSNGNKDTTFTQKTRLKDGSRISAVAFLADTSKRLVWVLRSERMHYVKTFKKYAPHHKDRSILLGSYDQDKNTLFYSITVANIDYIIPDSDFDFINHKEIYTNKYKIIISYSFMHIRSFPIGNVSFNATSPVRWNDDAISEERKNAASVPDAIFHNLILQQFKELASEWVEALVRSGQSHQTAHQSVFSNRLWKVPLQ